MARKWEVNPETGKPKKRRFEDIPVGEIFAFTQNNAVHHGRIAECRNVFRKIEPHTASSPNAVLLATQNFGLVRTH